MQDCTAARVPEVQWTANLTILAKIWAGDLHTWIPEARWPVCTEICRSDSREERRVPGYLRTKTNTTLIWSLPAAFWIRAQWNVGAAEDGGLVSASRQTFTEMASASPPALLLFVSFCLFLELRRSTWCCSSDRGRSDENTLTLERQFCWSCRVVGIWGDGCSLCPFSTHWLIDTVFIEDSLSCFTWDDRCKTKWTTASAGGAVVNNRWCCMTEDEGRLCKGRVDNLWWQVWSEPVMEGSECGCSPQGSGLGLWWTHWLIYQDESTASALQGGGAGDTWAKSEQVQMFSWCQREVSDL